MATCSDAVSPSDSFACVIRLQINTRVAFDAAIASGMPLTSRFVISDVYSEPGPSVIRSALAIASSVWGRGSAPEGSSVSSTIVFLLRVMFVSPSTI